jgi:hypothetical protein
MMSAQFQAMLVVEACQRTFNALKGLSHGPGAIERLERVARMEDFARRAQKHAIEVGHIAMITMDEEDLDVLLGL